MNAAPVPTYDDEIDLREIFQTIWKARLVVIISTLAAAVIAYAVSAWLLPKQYQAAAYVVISRPTVQYAGQEGGISAVPVVPDIKALPELVKIESILDQVVDDSRVAPLLASNGKQLSQKIQVSVFGNSQLRFQVTDTDPQRAAILATVWAEKAAEWVEFNYGLGGLEAALDSQITQTEQKYAEAQSALEIFLTEDPTRVLQSRVSAQTDAYACLEKRIIAAGALDKRLDELKEKLTESDEPVTLSDALLLASIRQDIDTLETCGSAGVILQSPSPTLFNGISSTQGLAVITSLNENLQQRIANSKHDQEALQMEILDLQVEIEQLSYRFNEYVRERDQTKLLYSQLVYQRSVMENVLQQGGRVATISAEAIVPQSASSPNPLLNTAAAGMVGLILSVLGILAVEWWRKST